MECLSHKAVQGEEADFYAYTREWVKTVDRGGVFHINDLMLFFFFFFLMATQALLPKHIQNSSSDKDSLQQKIIMNEDVQFYWSMVSVDMEDETASVELLQSIVELWVRVRGFSITAAWMEQYKHASQKVTKAQKGQESSCTNLDLMGISDYHHCYS